MLSDDISDIGATILSVYSVYKTWELIVSCFAVGG